MRVLICGSRTFPEDDVVIDSLMCGFDEDFGGVTFIAGGAKGADTAVRITAEACAYDFVEYRADWESLGKAAGAIRNQRMLDDGKPDLVVAFVDKPLAESKGTADMVRRAQGVGVPVYVVLMLRAAS